MEFKLVRSPGLRAIVVACVLLGAGFIFLAQSVSAQGGRTELVLGLQNDMTTLDFFNPETNTVWNYYQVGWTFDSLFDTDPDFNIFALLADPARGTSGPGYTFVTAPTDPQPVIDVFIRTGVPFHDSTTTTPQTLTADDVVFTYQTLAWSTAQTYITSALWWDAPKWPHWDGIGMSHIGIVKKDASTVTFHLSKPYALFFIGTLGGRGTFGIIPKHIWKDHINPNPPINITSLQPISDSADRSIDFSFGSSPTQLGAVVGTGFFKFDYWTPNSGSHISVYDNYWGKGKSVSWGGVSYPFFPEHLRSIKFVIYTSLDVISLALQKGEIDSLIWTLTPGFLSQVRFNPSISVEQVTDAGYFYLAFNLRRKPWNDLVLRQAISRAIDKDYIVNTLMGGFGIKGTVPISVHTPSYVNTSAAPPTFDLNAAKALLDANGIVDRTGDGFREYKDGSPIRATILTPPKDYDPVRADAGIMISNNLKSIGLNIDSAPTSFDTIVSKAFTEVDFDIYILGWLLTGTPESYLKDFFSSKSDVAINPAGSNSAGYRNAKVDTLLDQMETTLDNTARIKIVQDIEGIVTNDIPWNVLYYRKNLNAYRNDAWVGWVNTPPQLYNFWSLVKLRTAGAVVVPPPTGVFSVALTVPERAIGGHTVTVDTFVSQSLVPVSGATVTLNATWGSEFRTVSGTTDVSGHARFAWKVPVIQGNLQLKATATKSTSTATTTKLLEITVGPPAPFAQLNLSTTKPVLGVGETASVVATLVDGSGAPMPGVTVTIDKTLLLGAISPISAATDAAGKVTFTYTAPATAGLFPNQHLTDFVKASVNVPDVVGTDTQSASMLLFVVNDNVPDWRIVTVQGTPKLNLSTVLPSDSTTMSVKVTDYAGVALQGKTVDVDIAGDGAWNLTAAPASAGSNVTTSAGIATFTLAPTAAAKSGNNATTVPVKFQVRNDPFQVTDTVGVLLDNLVSTGYSASLTVNNRTLDSGPTAGTADVTITVKDKLGLPAPNVPVFFQISYGALGLPAQFPFAMHYGLIPDDEPLYLGEGLDLGVLGGGSLGGSFANSVNGSFKLGAPTSVSNMYAPIPPGTPWGVENLIEDYEVLGDFGVIDSCDRSGNATGQNATAIAFNYPPNGFGPGAVPLVLPWPSDFKGFYYVNATSKTDINGQFKATFNAMPHRIDSGVQVKAYVGQLPGKKLGVSVDACNFASRIQNYTFVIDTGMVIKRAPVFALGSVWWDVPVLSSENLGARWPKATGVALHARFYARTGSSTVPLADPEVFLTRGPGRAARVVGNANTRSGVAFGTINAADYPEAYSNGVLTWNVTEAYTRVRVYDHSTWPWGIHTEAVPPLGVSQAISYAFVPADRRYAFGGREQLFGNDVDSYGPAFWLSPALAILIAKVPFEFTKGYLFVPTAKAFAAASVDKTIVAEAGTATATINVTTVKGEPIANATVWSGPYQAITDANGKATFTFSAGSGAIENLAVVTTPDGQVIRAWYGILASAPVLSYASLTVTPAAAGSASTISVQVTNLLAVAGPATVVLLVNGQAVDAQAITLAASASATVTFKHVFDSAGSYAVAVGDQTATASIAAAPGPDLTTAYALGGGLLVVGLAVGAAIGILMSRRRKRPPAAEAMKEEEETKPSEEELPTEL